MGIVTISASYGSGGSEIGPSVAEALGLPFVDRAIPQAVAHSLGVPVTEVEAQDEKAATGFWRLITSMATVPDLSGGGHLGYRVVNDARVFKEKTEQVLKEVADGPGGVILGRAAAVVIGDRPDALHVRLDGPKSARVDAVCQASGVDSGEAVRTIEENDRAREAYVKNFYKCDARDLRLYHLIIDATALPRQAIVDLIVRAALARGLSPAGGAN